MKVGIFINTTKSEANKKASEFGNILANNGIESKVVNLKEDCKDVDIIAVFGGDGTILRVVDFAISYDIPILAINIGTVGFLTSIEANELDKAVDLIKNSTSYEKRSVMKVLYGDKKYYALNEAIVERRIDGGSISEIADLNLEIGGQFVDRYLADGIIISTPTGSTAYSLSAGGSILTPELNAFSATPICSHSLHIRPIVYADNMPAKITVNEKSTKCALYVDGKFISKVAVGESVEVVKSKNVVKFFKTDNTFFEKLLVKLNSWGYTK